MNTETLLGEWTGRLIEYDYSGKIPTRIIPIEVNFVRNEQNQIITKIVFQGKTFEDTAFFENNHLLLDNFNFNLEQLYNHSYYDYKLDYSVLGMQMSQKIYKKTPYLLANVHAITGKFS